MEAHIQSLTQRIICASACCGLLALGLVRMEFLPASTLDTADSCTPYICEDGSVHPRCTEDGHPINYFRYPCEALSAEPTCPQHPCERIDDIPDGCSIETKTSEDGCALCPQIVCKGSGCADVYDPVCGVDGKTYGNSCEAEQANVEIHSSGECEEGKTNPADNIPIHTFTSSECLESIAIVPNEHNIIATDADSGFVIEEDSVLPTTKFWIYEFNGNEPPFTGKIYFSNAELLDTPSRAAHHTLQKFGNGKTYYMMTSRTLLLRCADGLTSLLTCGNATIDEGEECDDGNTSSDDGCSSLCIRVWDCENLPPDLDEVPSECRTEDSDSSTASVSENPFVPKAKKILDANYDGTVTEQEISYVLSLVKKGYQHNAYVMGWFDIDRDGYISNEELDAFEQAANTVQ